MVVALEFVELFLCSAYFVITLRANESVKMVALTCSNERRWRSAVGSIGLLAIDSAAPFHCHVAVETKPGALPDVCNHRYHNLPLQQHHHGWPCSQVLVQQTHCKTLSPTTNGGRGGFRSGPFTAPCTPPSWMYSASGNFLESYPPPKKKSLSLSKIFLSRRRLAVRNPQDVSLS